MSRRSKSSARENLKVIPGEGRRSSHLKQALTFYLTLALIAMLVVLVGYQWMGSFILARRIQVVSAEPGQMENSIRAEGVILRQEQVFYAPAAGVILEMAPGGERVPVEYPLITLAVITREEALTLIQPLEEGPEGIWLRIRDTVRGWLNGDEEEDEDLEGQLVVTGEIPPWFTQRAAIFSDSSGLLSYNLDGFETLDGSYIPDEEKYTAGFSATAPLTEGVFVEAGQPLFKLVDNWSWQYMILLPLEEGRWAAAQEVVNLVFDFAPEQTVRGHLLNADIRGEEELVYLRYQINTQVPGFEKVRRCGAVISFQRQQGLIVPEEALLKKDGEQGVFLNMGGTVIFSPVNVLRTQEGKALIEGIEAHSMVISKPQLVKEGQRLD